ncbi:HCP protein [Salix suchowensis]|nr:HCP protein [Salix suchowensis]
MQHPNRSVPSLPSHQNQNHGHDPNAPPVPQYDPTAVLDQFGAMRISDPTGQGSRYPPHPGDPIPRAASSMSVRGPQHQQHAYGHLRHANTLPPGPGYGQGQGHLMPTIVSGERGDPSMYPPPQQPEASYLTDNMQHMIAGQRVPIKTTQPTRAMALLNLPTINRHIITIPSTCSPLSNRAGRPASPGRLQYLCRGFRCVRHGASGSSSAYDPSYSTRSSYAASSISLPSSHSSQHGPGPYGPSSVHSHNEPEIAPRPSLERSGTSASVNLRTSKTKAVDLSAPPYTKEYIDQYRQRIKADPDPEAHFLYAKYLIDAARKIRADHKDQRAAKKYTELLITESLKVVRKLATQGEAYDEAQFFLANCYGTGALGLQVDHERAYHLYLQAAKQNHAAACYRVAVCNEIGAGTRKEPPRAAAFYRKAASLGDTPAMYKLGMILLNGTLGEAKNPREAINWLKRAAEQADEDNPHALHELGILHEQAITSSSSATKRMPDNCSRRQHILAILLRNSNSGSAMNMAAEKGDAEAELALSGWYLTGAKACETKRFRAYLWARRAANKD